MGTFTSQELVFLIITVLNLDWLVNMTLLNDKLKSENLYSSLITLKAVKIDI